MKLKTLRFLILACTLFCAGCYKVTIQQGNLLTDDNLQLIHVGMSRQELENLIGLPVLRNLFNPGETIYVYTLKTAYHSTIKRRLFVYFSGDRVANFVVE